MKKILLVEDDSFILDIYGNQLKRAGYLVDIANNGEMALEKVKSNQPDLMLLDIGLPGIDGWEVLKTIRTNPKTQSLKVIIASNNDKDSNIENIEELKPVKYFLKIETTAEEIEALIKEVLS